MAELKQVACEAIEDKAKDLHALSSDIWNHPEIGLEEIYAHDVLTGFLDTHGFQVERSYKMKTAFRATFGSSNEALPSIAVICEYDALPEIGHACGHNLISEVGVAAGLGIMAALKASEIPIGKVTILGTPAEENYGGKADLIEAGAFSDVDVAMMSHPCCINMSVPHLYAKKSMEITYTGKAAHSAAFPWQGINALDAAVLCYQGIACLRQQKKPKWSIDCVIVEGGVKANIIPERSVLNVDIRAPTNTELATLKDKVVGIFESGAKATGCTMEYRHTMKGYSAMITNKPLIKLFETNLAPLLPPGLQNTATDSSGGSDMGNVAHVVPSIHPMFYIGGAAVNHTREFTEDAGHARAQSYTLMQAKAIAMTAIDIMLDPRMLKDVQGAFAEDIKNA